MSTSFGCILLTIGTRPDDLRLALDSLRRQRGVDVDIVVVGNGWEAEGLPEGTRSVTVMPNRGIPGGRNAGIDHVTGEIVFFLDEDASLAADDALARVAAIFAAEPDVGMVQLRVEPREGDRRSSDWSPRVGAGGHERSGDVTLVWEGAVAIRRDVLDRVGRWPAHFQFIHEGVDLAWRVLDAGYRVRYAGDVVALHPSPPEGPVRHGYSTYFSARNRVFLARQYLPAPLGVVFVASFMARTLPRLRDRGEVRRALRGYRDGLRRPAGPRQRLRARTLWHMTRAGRPPVI